MDSRQQRTSAIRFIICLGIVIAFMAGALYAVSTRRSLLLGVMLGLSIAAKPWGVATP